MFVYKFEAGADELYINSYSINSEKTSYVNLSDLKQCLHLFFSGELDNVDAYLDRIYLPLLELNPSNTLFGQLDSVLLRDIVDSMPEDYRDAIYLNFAPTPEISEKVQHHYVHSETPLKFSEWIEDLYTDALHELAELVKREL